MNACQSDACQQGKANCPTPQACELPIQFAGDEPMPTTFRLIWWAILFFVALAAVSFIAGLMTGTN